MSDVTGIAAGFTLMIAEEASTGSVDATDARALDTAALAGLTWYSLATTNEAASAATGVKAVTDQPSTLTLAGGMAPLRVLAPIGDDGFPIDQRMGDIPIKMELRGMGTNPIDETGLGVLLASGLTVVARVPGTSMTGTRVSDNVFSVGGGDVAKIRSGDVIAVRQSNKTFRIIKATNVNDSTYSITTLEPHGIGTTAMVRQCHLAYLAPGGAPSGGTLAVQSMPRSGNHGVIQVAARATKVDVAASENSAMDVTVTVKGMDGEAISSAIATPTTPQMIGVTGSTALRASVAPVLVSADHSASSAPFHGAASVFPIRTWSASISIDLAPQQDQGTRSRVSDVLVTGAQLTGSFTTAAPTGSDVDFREVLRKSGKRSACFTAAGKDAAGNGFGLWVGSVEPASDPGITIAEKDRTQAPDWRAGGYSGDTPGEDHANAPWIIAFPC